MELSNLAGRNKYATTRLPCAWVQVTLLLIAIATACCPGGDALAVTAQIATPLNTVAAPHPRVTQLSFLDHMAEVAPHPRVLMAPSAEKAIAANIASDPLARQVHQLILKESDNMIGLAPYDRVVTGGRLLSVSRNALRRIFFLAYSFRMTGDAKYAARAEREMLAISAFSDWHPAHFLDVAEMTMAMAIGYDWTYSALSPASRRVIRDAIISKGLDPSLDPTLNSWLKVNNNWNQVCNAGMVFGAIAVYEEVPDKAKSIIKRAIDTVVIPMQAYEPDGAYPEGFGYWDYGTSFNVMMLGRLKICLAARRA